MAAFHWLGGAQLGHAFFSSAKYQEESYLKYMSCQTYQTVLILEVTVSVLCTYICDKNVLYIYDFFLCVKHLVFDWEIIVLQYISIVYYVDPARGIEINGNFDLMANVPSPLPLLLPMPLILQIAITVALAIANAIDVTHCY